MRQRQEKVNNICTDAQYSSKQKFPKYPPDSFTVGVETEFLLYPRSAKLNGSILRDVSIKAASAYNLTLSERSDVEHPKMHNAIDQAYRGLQYAEWTLDSDSTIEMPNKDSPPCVAPRAPNTNIS